MDLLRPTAIAALLIAATALVTSAGDFEARFVDATLRIDLFLLGDADTERAALDRLIATDGWAGPTHGRLDGSRNGRYVARLVDPTDGTILFQHGFDSLFGEYRTTEPARRGVVRVVHESVLTPLPRDVVRLVVARRQPTGGDESVLLDMPVDPHGTDVVAGGPNPEAMVFEHRVSGPPSSTLDIAFIGEGYAAQDVEIFRADLAHYGDLLLSQRPYSDLADRISVRGVLRPSRERGSDEPTRGIWRDTALDSSFNTLGSPRYLLPGDNRSLRDIAAAAPYDTLIVMVNHDRYGGGGIYNRSCTFTAHGPFSGYLLLHELGHSFAGLADEYYTSATSYSDFYPSGIEPVEPNVSATADRESIKWADLISPSTPLPTPWGKDAYDRADLAYQEARRMIDEALARAHRSGAMRIEIDMLRATADEHAAARVEAVDRFMAASGLDDVVGAFEGAGYVPTGLYRPSIDCLMFSRGEKPLCPVCRRAVANRIDHYIGR